MVLAVLDCGARATVVVVVVVVTAAAVVVVDDVVDAVPTVGVIAASAASVGHVDADAKLLLALFLLCCRCCM